MPVFYDHTQYSGIWTLDQVGAAVGQSLWPTFGPRLFAWGYNGGGQLGLGNNINYSSPKQVGSGTNWSSIAAGLQHDVAIKTDGSLWTWGYNALYGGLGLGNNINYSSPKQVGALTTWSFITAGTDCTFSIKTDGTLWAWGRNDQGQLGLNNKTPYSSPKQVGALTNWSNISTGYNNTLAIKTDGTLWTWGNNGYGQLGLNNTTSYSSPKQVGVGTNWSKISGGAGYSITIKTDGTLWAWGRNDYGQLGLGNITNYSSPKQIGALTTWLSIAASYNNYLIAIKTDGTLWAWGYNGFGSLGLGNRTNYSSPKQVGALTNWSIISSPNFDYSTFVIKTDGTLWAWGYNFYGELGFGNTTYYSSPKQVGTLATWQKITVTQGSTLAINKF